MAKGLLCTDVHTVCTTPWDFMDWGKETSNMKVMAFVLFCWSFNWEQQLAQDLRNREQVKQCFPKLTTPRK